MADINISAMQRSEAIEVGKKNHTKEPETSKPKGLAPILLKIQWSHHDFSVGYKEGLGFSLVLC